MKKVIIIFSACVLVLVASVFAIHYYFRYSFAHNLINETVNVPLTFRSDTTDVDLMQLKGKYIVLYFWDSTGKDCLKDLEKYQKIYDSKFKNDSRVKMYAVHCNSGNESNSTTETDYLQADDCGFSSLSLYKNDILQEQLKINAFPTVLIISPDWKIKFRGSIDDAYYCILGLTYSS
jgi:peroxiredoxin